ncbi:MAG: ADOP family duplicated permease, partial [Blastocatellia bacterium]
MPDWKSEIRSRLAGLHLAPLRENAIVEELAAHLDDCYAELLSGGATEAEAYRATLAELSESEILARELRRVERQVAPEPIVLGTNRRTNMIADLWQDLRYGARMLLKQPGFTLIAVVTLALGIGATTAILSTVNGMILRPLPVEKPDELMTPFWGSKKDAEVWGGFSYANYKDLREQNRSLAGLLAWRQVSAGISADNTGKGDSIPAEVAFGELVSANYFDVLGVKPILGRGFLPEAERTQNTHSVVVISEPLWQERFQRDAAIAGKTIYLNGSPFTVVGVAPASFKGVKFAFRQAFWVPLMMSAKVSFGGDWETNRAWRLYQVLGRRKPGVTMAQAEADLNRVAHSLAQQFPKTNADTKVQVVSQQDGKFSDDADVVRLSSALALGVSLLVLLVACANVANLMLARAAARTKEIGIRLAIGAGRWRIIRQLLTESVLLAGLGGALGCVFAYWGASAIEASFPPIPYPIDLDFSPDKFVLSWMVVTSVLTGVVFGLAPALVASRPDLVAVIKGDAVGQLQTRRRWNLRGALVVAQVAISLIVLICAGLFLRSLNRAVHLDPGFSVENLVTMRMDPGLLAYSQDEGNRFYAEALRRIETLPGVRAVSLADTLPLSEDDHTQGPMTKEGEPDPPPNQGLDIACNIVAPKYFETLRTSLVLGRDFTERDTKDAPQVVIVNQEFARKFY